MEERAQVHVEYLLMLVGVVVVVTVVSFYIKTTANSVAQATQAQAEVKP